VAIILWDRSTIFPKDRPERVILFSEFQRPGDALTEHGRKAKQSIV
jgi:hypothetical protein